MVRHVTPEWLDEELERDDIDLTKYILSKGYRDTQQQTALTQFWVNYWKNPRQATFETGF